MKQIETKPTNLHGNARTSHIRFDIPEHDSFGVIQQQGGVRPNHGQLRLSAYT